MHVTEENTVGSVNELVVDADRLAITSTHFKKGIAQYILDSWTDGTSLFNTVSQTAVTGTTVHCFTILIYKSKSNHLGKNTISG